MTIDFKNKKFYFQADAKEIDTEKKEYGFDMTLKAEKLIIGFVWAEYLKGKMKYGDEVIEVNGTKIDENTLCQFIVGNSIVGTDKQSIILKIKTAEGEISEIKVKKKLPSKLYNPK